MSLARVVVTAVLVEGSSKASRALDSDVARSWVCELVRRFKAEREAASVTPSSPPLASMRR
jgi:hypothetical protein